MARVVVGLSGGVDSSVAAALLQQQGHEVIGLFMRNWNDASVTLEAECPWVEDSNDALLVAEKLGIPFQVLDLSAPYKERIVDYMFAEYQAGRTPNPDILCNREIKFDLFLKAALSLGADFVATGHYAQKGVTPGNLYTLLAGEDASKDQSYFLCQLTQEQLAKALFPIGHLKKTEVRKQASSLGLATADKKDSQGLCFIGKVKLPDFLQQQLEPKKGDIVELPSNLPLWSHPLFGEPWALSPSMGKVVGTHSGAHYFTIGQRKGLWVGGKPSPLFVVATDTHTNTVYVGQSKEFPGLYRPFVAIAAEDVHWIRPDLALHPGERMEALVRIRYRQPLQKASVRCLEDGALRVDFSHPQKAVAPGQFLALYLDKECVASGAMLA